MKTVAILGYDIEGKASYEYYKKLGCEITICDQATNINIPIGAQAKLGYGYLDNLAKFDLLVRTPGLHPSKILAKNPDVKSKIWTATNEFFKVCPSKNIIGVTGTKGKGTTSSLIYEILKRTGKQVHLGGNIGIAMLSLLNDIKPDDWVVLELSNFQLIDFIGRPKIGVCLMVAPEHLDWHSNVQEYYSAKSNLFNHQTSDDLAIYNTNNHNTYLVIKDSSALKIPFDVPTPPLNTSKNKAGVYIESESIYYKGQPICDVTDIALHGRHNLQNVSASIGATYDITKGNALAIVNAIKDFKGLEHRIEFVNEIDGIGFVNDSFATTPEASLAAMRSFAQPKVMILGGHDKGVGFEPIIKEVLESNVRHVICIGDTGRVMAQQLRQYHYPHITEGLTKMDDIVNTARDKAKKGDVVLLSTASASFGLFDNYKDRGHQFKKAVLDL
jgi:UDP-N-acetylmuramoylalanine--D-glutamate ligase